MELDKLSKARDLYYEYEKVKQLEKDIAEVPYYSMGFVGICTPPEYKDIRKFGLSDYDTEFLNDILEAVRWHLQRIINEIHAL